MARLRIESQPGSIPAGWAELRHVRNLVLVTLLLAAAGCVERTVAPVDPHPDMHGTWKGTRTLLVFDGGGAVVPDTSVKTTLTLVIASGGVSFTDSKEGQLPTAVNSQDNDRISFNVTNGLASWVESAVRTGRTLNGTTRNAVSTVIGVWALTRQ